MLPEALRSTIESAMSGELGKSITVREAQPVGGGCISHATRVVTSSGDRAFLKWCRRGELPDGIFEAEAIGLQALADAGAVRVPHLLAQSYGALDCDWLLLEWLEPARLAAASWRELGAALAQLHLCSTEQFGWDEANFIGSLPQSNDWSDDWPAFWRDQRLLPQLERASRTGELGEPQRMRFDSLMNALPELLAAGNSDGPSLLHGDLWNGNVHGAEGGTAALIDPSIYYGHREVDLAMAALFGGFSDGFFEAYDEAWPLEDGADRRKLVYQLYYLLVHVNLFGASYVERTLSAVGELGF